MKTGSPKGAGCTDVPPSQLLLVRSCRGGGGEGRGEGRGKGIVAWSRLCAR